MKEIPQWLLTQAHRYSLKVPNRQMKALKDGYVAGALSCQPEIDELKAEIKRLKELIQAAFNKGYHTATFKDEKSWQQFKQTNHL